MCARQASDKRTADLIKAGLGEGELQQVGALASPAAAATAAARGPSASNSSAAGGSGSGSGGGRTLAAAPSSGSKREAAAATWSSALFDPDTFPDLKLTAEVSTENTTENSRIRVSISRKAFFSFFRA